MVAGTEDGIVMVEAGAQQATEEEVLDAIEFGHDCCKKIAAGIRELVEKAGKKKWAYTPPAINKDSVRSDRNRRSARTERRAEHPEVREARKLRARSRRQEEGVEALPEEQQSPKARNCSTA